ncbi:hypothetical protein AOQ84DRAFT_375034 [Glonium stellatum]|uniref:Uncharacterized protein n=1 Tax=Glonium stellatum TaxID=574774 RepID=A0A8E2JV39_9PEZI|nr:hypothetical protein AOQ84DRAFT_375034 [Glonium stellatum]
MVPNPDQSTTKNEENLTFRPRIIKYQTSNKFCPNDLVYWHEPGGRSQPQGPFVIEEVPKPQTYNLCKEDKTPWRKEVPEDELRRAP